MKKVLSILLSLIMVVSIFTVFPVFTVNAIGSSFTATFKNWDGTVLYTETINLFELGTPTYDGPTPTRPSDGTYNYTFAGWSPFFSRITEDTDFIATYDAHPIGETYTITWKNFGGEILEVDTDVAYGATPSYDGATPTKSADAQYTYSFGGWYPGIKSVTSDASYTAWYNVTVNSYTVTWQNNDGTILEVDENVPYGTTPTYNGATPVKACDNPSNFSFIGWDSEVTAVTGEKVYTAVYQEYKGVKGHSISLNGDIGLNYYLDRYDVPEGTVLNFAWYNKTAEHTVSAQDYDSASGYYRVQLSVAAAEMSCPVTLTYQVDGEENVRSDVFSVRDYADVILDSNSDFSMGYIAANGEEKYDILVDLTKKMLDFGSKAQTRFGVTDVPLANEGVDYTMNPVTPYHIKAQKTDMITDLHKYGMDYIGTSVLFLSGTTLRHNYVISDKKLFEQVKDTANFDFVDKGTRICFELKNIPAAQLDVAKAFTLGDTVYRYSVLDYCKLVIADEDKPQVDRELCMATYWYNDAAKAYFYGPDEYEDDMT